ncbi:MAG: hypothetical protein WD766_04980 [Gemmatimonadota bacterium]
MKLLRPIGLLSLLVLLSFGGCSAAAAGSGGGNPDVITADDLSELSSTNLYEAVQRLRPQWLRTRGISSFGGEPDPIMVYVDNVRYGEVRELTGFRIEAIEEVERIDATSATQRWGTGHAGGVLLVSTRGGG